VAPPVDGPAAATGAAVGEVLVVNAGSSSLKVSLLGPGGVLRGTYDDLAAVGDAPVDAVGHRVVHGGGRADAVVVDDAVERELAGLADLAPLHQPPALRALAAARERWPGAAHVACFDTAFHAVLPEAARTYALPAAWRGLADGGVRRYGFHGLSHAWAAGRAAALVPGARRVVVAHLGAGASLCAVVDGRSVDTTMGFTPVEGLVMATRAGDVDPGLLTWLVTHGGLTPQQLESGLSRESGLLGLAGTPRMEEVLARAGAGDPDAVLARDVHLHRLVRLVGAMAASAGGLDALVLTGGVGERAPALRQALAARLGWLGVAVDPARDAAADPGTDTDVTADGARVRVLVVHAREDLEVDRQVRALLG